MRTDPLHLAKSRPVSSPAFFAFSRFLRALGWVSLLIMGTLGNLVADDPINTPGAVSSPPVTDNSLPPDTSTSAKPSSGNSPNTPQEPDSTQSTINGPPQYTPLLPGQGGNPYSPFSPYNNNYQSPYVTAPNLYTTGVNDIGRVGTNTALSQAFGNESSSGFLSEPDMGYSYPPIERIQLGPIDLKAAAVATIVADDNLRINGNGGTNGNGTGTPPKEHDVYYSLTPAVLFEYGNHEGQKGYASLVYAPTITRYFHYSAQNSNDQNVSLNLRYPFQRLSLDATETYTQTTGYNEDINAQTTDTANAASFGGSYEFDDKLSFASHIQNTISSYEQPGGNNNQAAPAAGVGQGDTVTSVNSSLIYHLSDKMSLVGSGNVGIDKPKGEKQQTFEQALLGVNYQPTQKISMAVQGGAEFRQGIQNNFGGGDNSQSGSETNPIFSVELGYVPFDSTTLSVLASQGVYTSSAANQQTVVTSTVTASATQRFFQRFFLNFTIGYTHNENQQGTGNENLALANETTDLISYRTSLSVAPTAWTSVAIYYQYLDNQSNIATETYHDNQLGLSISAQF